MKLRIKRIVVPLALLVAMACASAPPTLTTAGGGKQAFYATRVIKGLDVLRDIAIAATDQVPPVIPEDTTRGIVLFHRSAITTVHAAPSGWKATVLTGLDETVKGLPPDQAQVLAPYVQLVKVILQEATQ